LVAGKWMAASLAALLSVCLTTALCAQLTRILPLEDLGIQLRIGVDHLGAILFALGPMCLFTAAMQATVATLARSFKEAQTYMGVLILAPMLPGIMAALYPVSDAPWMYAVPMLGPYVLLTSVLGGRTLDPDMFLISGAVALFGVVVLLRITTALFRSEQIIFGR
jgi:sodium transport system permease protein